MKKLLIAVALFLLMVSGSFGQRFNQPHNPTINANSPYFPTVNPPAGNWWDIHSPNWNTNQPGAANSGVPGGYGPYYNPYYDPFQGSYTVPSP